MPLLILLDTHEQWLQMLLLAVVVVARALAEKLRPEKTYKSDLERKK